MVTIEKIEKTAKVLNKVTGEVREVPIRKVISCNIDKADTFYQQYANGVMAVCGVKPDFCAKVYMYLCMKATDNEIYITKSIRDDIQSYCGISKSSSVLALKILDENGIIKRVERGRYLLNPVYSWSGKSSDRALLLDKAKVSIKIELMPNEELYEEIE